MKQHLTWAMAAAVGLVTSLPLAAQHQERPPAHEEHPPSHEPSQPRANQGHVPPPPAARPDRARSNWM